MTLLQNVLTVAAKELGILPKKKVKKGVAKPDFITVFTSLGPSSGITEFLVKTGISLASSDLGFFTNKQALGRNKILTKEVLGALIAQWAPEEAASNIRFLLEAYRKGGKNGTLAKEMLLSIPDDLLIDNIEELSSYIDCKEIKTKYLALQLALKAISAQPVQDSAEWEDFLYRCVRVKNQKLSDKAKKIISRLNEPDEPEKASLEEVMESPADYSEEEVENSLLSRLKEMEEEPLESLRKEEMFLKMCLMEKNKNISSRARRILKNLGLSRKDLEMAKKGDFGPM